MRLPVAGTTIATLAWAAACGVSPDAPATVDLIAALPTAERRAAGSVDEAVRTSRVEVAGVAASALLMRAPARVIWPLRIPPRSAFATSVAIVPATDSQVGSGVTLRIGVSDDRHYEGLLTLAVKPDRGWQSVTVDLRRYAGWQWSLFYRPSEILWKFIVNVDATPGGTIAARAPAIRPLEGRSSSLPR